MSDLPASPTTSFPGVAPEVAPRPSEPTPTAPAAAQAPRPERYPLEFTGSAGEYFRVWIVSMLLTVVTLGIYFAWAKVRLRRYLYQHTRLGGTGFDYLARPRAILLGHLLVGGGFVVFYALQYFNPLASLALIPVGYLLFPWLIWKSLRFRTRYSSYRGVRFAFHGTLGRAYKVYLLYPFLALFSFGLAVPAVLARQRAYLFDNAAFGRHRSRFRGEYGDIAKYYFAAAGIALLGYLPVFVLSMGAGLTGRMPDPIVYYIVVLPLFLLAAQVARHFLDARVTNALWNEVTLSDEEGRDRVEFRSDLRARRLIWIGVTNAVAIALTLGLATPWAAIRYHRYRLEHIAVDAEDGLDAFTGADAEREDALGDAAADAFDFEIAI